MNHALKHYKTTAVRTAGRGQILIMLYESAIQNLKQAIIAAEKNDLGRRGVLVGRTHEIINELSNTLDFEVGGDIARDLERLYVFMIDSLVLANRHNESSHLATVQKLLETLLSAWRVAVDEFHRQGSPTR